MRLPIRAHGVCRPECVAGIDLQVQDRGTHSFLPSFRAGRDSVDADPVVLSPV